MVCGLIDFVLVVVELLMFKVCGIIGISKIEFFNFSGTERVKQKRFHEHIISEDHVGIENWVNTIIDCAE